MKTTMKKIIASSLLAMFTLSNTLLASVAMEDVNAKPKLRDGEEYSLRLKGDISYIKSNEPISISLRDSDVKQVLRMFADKAGMNIMFHNSVTGTVTLDLVNVPLSDAFDMVMGINNLNYVVEDNTIIVAGAGATGFNMAKQDMTLIPVKYINANALADFLNNNIFKMNKPGLSGNDVVSTNPVTNELIIFGSKNDVTIARKVVEKFDKKPTTTVFKVNHSTPQEMADMICNMLLPAANGTKTSNAAGKNHRFALKGVMTGAAASSSSSGGSSGGGDMTLNSGKVACTIDSKATGSVPLQNMSVAYYPQLGTVNILGGSEQQLEMIKSFIQDTDKKPPQAYLEVSIIELNEDGSKTLSNTWNIQSEAFSATFDGTRTGTTSPVYFAGDGKDKYKGPFTLSYTINYILSTGKGRVVVNPKIIITNGVESKIEVTEDYVESTDVNASTSTGGTVVTMDYNVSDDQGVTLSIKPFISHDGYVTLSITPEYSTFKETVQGTQVASGVAPITYTAATLLTHRNLDLKNIRIKDGETLVIAGMIQEKEIKTVDKVPFLGDLPVIGTFFRDTTTQKAKSEMLIMLTPKIITDNDDAVSNTETL